ncbi:MAG: single-stranded DNA-binding protein [Elusimicrobia bacterium]|nr:single-stranded DNA-binding protein [Elusimicrobiota bacterium]
MAGVRLPEINFVLLAGRVTRDAEMFFTPSGVGKCTIRIAVNRRVKDAKSGEWKDDVFYVDVIAWRELADRSKDKAKKGVPLIVEGRLTCREYEDKKSGQKRSVFEVMANRIQYLSAAAEGAASSSGAGTKPEAEAESIEEVPF